MYKEKNKIMIMRIKKKSYKFTKCVPWKNWWVGVVGWWDRKSASPLWTVRFSFVWRVFEAVQSAVFAVLLAHETLQLLGVGATVSWFSIQ